jgi:hypothetical protein
LSTLALDELAPPAVVELATLASPAVQLEAALLRELRLGLFPRHGPELEADLWFSPLVAARNPRGVVLGEQTRDALLTRLGSMLPRPAGATPAQQMWARRAEQAWESISDRHSWMAPALALEESVAWLVVNNAGEAELEAELAPALAALESGARPELTRWAGFAWGRLPDRARETRAGWLLGQVGGEARARPRLRPGTLPGRLAGLDIAAVLRDAGQVKLAVRRERDVLEAGAITTEGAVAILVPDTDPRVLELQFSSTPLQLEVPVGGRASARVGTGELSIRTLTGDVYEFEAPVAPGERQARGLLEAALVEVGEPDRAALGFFVESNRLLTLASVVREPRWGQGREEPWPVPIAKAEDVAEGAVESQGAGLALLFVDRPLGVPLTLPTAQPSSTEPWVAASSLRPFRLGGAASGRPSPAPGGAALADGVPAGIVSDERGLIPTAVAAQFLQAARLERPRRDARAYAECAQAVALWYHTRLSGLIETGEEDLLRRAGEANGLSDEQTDHLRSLGEWLIAGTVSEALAPGWAADEALLGLASVSADAPYSVVASATSATLVRTLAGQEEQRIEILGYSSGGSEFRLLAPVFKRFGIGPGSSRFEVTGTTAAFADALGDVMKDLESIAPAYDSWDERQALPPAEPRADELLAEIMLLVDELTAVVIRPPVSPWRVLTSRVRPPWRHERDQLVALGIPGAATGLDIQGLLRVYLDGVGGILRWLTEPLGSRIAENGYGIGTYALNLVRQHESALAGRLEPNRRLRDDPVAQLTGPFEVHVALYAWSGARLLEQLPTAMRSARPPARTPPV